MKKTFLNWVPAVLTMAVIFWFSSQPADELPVFSRADTIIKKAGHVIGYGILAYCYWHALGTKDEKRGLAWLLAILYAVSDEYHQSFTAGRHPSLWDVVIFDNIGALLALWFADKYIKQKRPGTNT